MRKYQMCPSLYYVMCVILYVAFPFIFKSLVFVFFVPFIKQYLSFPLQGVFFLLHQTVALFFFLLFKKKKNQVSIVIFVLKKNKTK